jgi:hypothetical protein
MRLDLRHHIFKRLGGIGCAGALGQRKIAQPGRSQREVNRHRHDREPNQG